jgi:crotonobetainyl-CoA:carnitine CoA-transferase CaiB-like acyl-CoA transferase
MRWSVTGKNLNAFVKALNRLVNSVQELIEHPQLRTRPMPVNGQMVELPAIPYITEWDDESYRPIPGVDEHGDAIRDGLEALSRSAG